MPLSVLTLQIGLRVRITADRKARYTLLLGFPVFQNFEAQKWLFLWNGSFRLASKHRFAQYTESEDIQKSRRQQKIDPLKLEFPKGTTSLHIE